MKKSIAIIGSGPSALMLAAHLDEQLYDITIYERNSAPARKFLVAGDGGFNLTHSEETGTFISRYTPSYFLENSIRSFTNTDFREWLKSIGIDTFIGSSKRVFPVKGIKPIDVLQAILSVLKSKNVLIKTQHEWQGWNKKNELIIAHSEKVSFIKPDLVVFALGGASWSKTGSDGSWLDLFKEKGVGVIPFQASNGALGIKWDEKFIGEFEGQSLKNISLSCSGKKQKGEVVVTKFGMEGGVAYSFSPEIRKQLKEQSTAELVIDLKPSFTIEEVRNKLSVKGTKSISKLLKDELNLSEIQLALLKMLLTKEEFIHPERLSEKIKKLSLRITSVAPVDEAISTVGGISLNEADDGFQLKKLHHHYVLGEMLDWDAPTGGYLLQACFSMGYYLAKKLNFAKN